MLRIFSLLVVLVMASMDLMAGGPLKKPLTFVESDSIVVWGSDRSDFRATALSVAPELKAQSLTLDEEDIKKYKKIASVWRKEILPSLNILGGLGEIGNQSQVLPTTHMMTEAGKLFLQSGDASYMDVVERTSLNALMAVLSPGELSFEKHIAAQALMNVSGMVYATDDAGLYINFYINNSCRIKTDKLNFVIDQLTAMPHSNRVKLRIEGMKKGQQPIVLRLRMPSWAYGDLSENMKFQLSGTPEKVPVVYVNGREENYPVENGYMIINRLWNSGDEVYFDFPFHMQQLYPAEKCRTNKSKFALQRGPLVYGLSETYTDVLPSDKLEYIEREEPNEFGHSVIIIQNNQTEDKTQKLETQPVMDGVKQLWLNAKF